MPPVITQMGLEHFRLFDTAVFEPGPGVSVLLGANNSGKSNLIDALAFLKDCRDLTIGQAFQRRHDFDRIAARHDVSRTADISLTLSDGLTVLFRLSGGQAIEFRTPDGNSRQAVSGTQLTPGYGGLEGYESFITSLVHVDPFRNVQQETPVAAKTTLSATGGDLATILHYHYTNSREGFDAYEDAVRSVLPEVDIIETPILSSASTTVSVRFVDDSLKYDLWQVSSGVKDVLLLVAALHFSNPESVILVEEPENHLHPTAQRALASLMRRVSQDQRKQIIATTHSEIILREFDPADVWFVEKRDGRATLNRYVETELQTVWDQLGFEAEGFVEILGNVRQVFVIVEGRADQAALEPLWRELGISDVVVTRRSDGGGYAEVAAHARALQDAFDRFRIPIRVFVLFDNDGERDAKVDALRLNGFDESTSHVWNEKEMESYLAIPSALAGISGRPGDEVEQVLADAGSGKEAFANALGALGIQGTPPNTIMQFAIASDPESVPAEFRDIGLRVRVLAGR